MNKEELVKYLKTNLSLRIVTSDEYNGGMIGSSMYTPTSYIQLILDEEVISSISL